jgi:hypothetical protein
MKSFAGRFKKCLVRSRWAVRDGEEFGDAFDEAEIRRGRCSWFDNGKIVNWQF